MKFSFLKNKIVFLTLSTLIAAGCSGGGSSSSTTPKNTPNTGFEVTPPTDGTDEPGTNPDHPSNGGTQPDDGSSGQNPGDDDSSGGEVLYGLILNNGAAYTHDQQLHLSLLAPVAIQSIKVGQTKDCSDGIVKDVVTSLTIPVFKRNAVNVVSVQFISFSGAIGACLVKSIVQDDQGPDVVISQYPMSTLEEGSHTELKYSVTDISGVKEVKCSLNETVKPCTSGDATVKLTNMAAGDYTFKVSAQDKFGFTSEKSVSWKVTSSYKRVNQVVEIKDERKVDILMVVDNSQSMEYEQKSMANRVGSMLNVLQGLDWQIAVTTTDPRNIALGDGRLIPIYGTNELFLKSSTTNHTEAQYRLGMTLQRPEIGSASEQPINSTYRFVERALGNDTAYRKFFRENSNFAVIVISDEDESDNKFRNDPQNLINLVSTSFNQQKVFTWHSIITKPDDKACRNSYGATYGVRLARFSEMTGGIVGSVCEADYASQVTGIANSIVNMNKQIALTCQALAQFPIVLKKDGQTYNKTFVQEGLKLKFNEVLEPGVYSLEYSCMK